MNGSDGHRVAIGAWLRASVLGASDGVVSTASLVLGVAAADASSTAIATAGLAGLFGGALSMAAGEYVSVSSERDLELAELEREKRHLEENPKAELDELTAILASRGLSDELAKQAAIALTEHDALGAHAREELGIEVGELARPVQAAFASAVSFAVGAAIPLAAMVASPIEVRPWATLVMALLSLAALGTFSARLGGSPATRTILRVVGGGAIAMALTSAIGYAFGAAF